MYTRSKNARKSFTVLSAKKVCSLIFTKAWLNLKSEVSRSYFSYLWWIIEPLAYMAIFYLVFGVLLNRGEDDYIAFLLAGLVPWMWFAKSVNGASTSLIGSARVIHHFKVPLYIFPLISIVQSTIKFLPVLLLLLAFVFVFVDTQVLWSYLLLILLLQLLLLVFISLVVAALVALFRDFSSILTNLMTFTMFVSGVFYSYKSISEEWQQVYLSNPVAYLLKSYREVLLEQTHPSLSILFSGVMILLVLITFTLLTYRSGANFLSRVIEE